MMLWRYSFSILLIVVPFLTFAESEAVIEQEVKGLIVRFVEVLVDPAVVLLFALAFLIFMWGLLQFMMSLSSGEPSTAGKSHMLWGIFGLVIMFSVAGIINVITSSIGDTKTNPIEIQGGFK